MCAMQMHLQKQPQRRECTPLPYCCTHLLHKRWQVLDDGLLAECWCKATMDDGPLLLVIGCEHWVGGLWL
jgi:hypothetical protein